MLLLFLTSFFSLIAAVAFTIATLANDTSLTVIVGGGLSYVVFGTTAGYALYICIKGDE